MPENYLPIPVLQRWMEHPEEITGEDDVRRVVKLKKFHEQEKALRAHCAVCIGGGYAKALHDHDPEKARGILQGLAAAEEEKFIKFSLHKAIDELVESWPRQTKLLQTAQEQIRESFTSRYIREVLQRLEV